ncbi:MAG: NAD-dependent epimerase/dehydratase family protein [Cyanobacteriota bacterium]
MPNSSRIISADTDRVLATNLPWQAFDGARIVVTGAAGFLGGGLVRALLALHPAGLVQRPLQVLALVRHPERSRQRLADVADDPQLEWLTWDLCQFGVPELGRPDFVIHAASQASPKFFSRDPVGTLLPNTVGTAALLKACAPPCRFLYVSSSEVYGSVSTTDPLKEQDLGCLDLADVRSCYSESKRLGEALCVAWHAQYELQTLIVRPFHTYGPGLASDDGRVFADFAFAIAHGQPIIMTSDGSARRAFCYSSDAIAGMFTVLLKGEPPCAYNLANPFAEVSILELANLLVCHFAQRGARLERSAPPDGYAPSPFNRMVPDISRLQSLGWVPHVGLIEGFERFVEALS